MKVTKPLIIAALVAGNLLAWDLARAEDSTNKAPVAPPAGQLPRGGGFDRVAEQLNLTADQKPKVKAVMEEQRQKMSDLHKDTSLSKEDRQAKMQAIHSDVSAKLKDVLTPEQFAKWQKMGPGNHRPGGQPPAANPPTGANN